MFENREGQRVPQATFHTRREHDWVDVSSDEIFKGRTVIVFSLPGAFTPTCSSSHVPRFNQLAPVFKAHGVDEIICVSVNDAFVMNEWAIDQKAENITFLPDGNGEFTAGMGLLVDKDDLGFGKLLFDQHHVRRFDTEPEPGNGNESESWPRGRMLGGSSTVNGMFYTRGQAQDFDDWSGAAVRWHPHHR